MNADVDQVADPSEPYTRRSLAYSTRRVLRRCRELLGDDPVFLPVVLLATPLRTSRRITEDTEIVIEGFPRSGNTFAHFALQESQGRDVRIASHVHVPSQVKVAVSRAKPTLYVVREPVGCITSLLAAAPHVRFEAALREYVHHHRELLPYRDRMVVSTFETTTQKFDQVIGALNDRFDTGFRRWEQDDEANQRVFDRIDAHYREVYGPKAVERKAPRPSAARRAEKEWLTAELRSSRLAEAQATYDEFVEGSAL